MSASLKAWLAKTGTTQRKLAVDVGVREATVSGWIHGIVPLPVHMRKVETVTDGEVPVTSWFDEEPSAPEVAAE